MTKQEKIEKIFGKFKYISNKNGSITIQGDWIKTYIKRLYIGRWTIWCHALIINQLENMYKELERFNIENELSFSNGGGCFVPRHKCWDVKRGLSFHSWGIALDIDPKRYAYGSKAKPHPALIQAFEKHGFIWGGDWRTPDPMHFEWRRFV